MNPARSGAREDAPRGVVVPVEGDLDLEGCQRLRTRLAAALATGARYVVLDLDDATSFSQEAADLLRGLRRYLQRSRGDVVVVRPSPSVRSGLRVHDLDDLMTLDDRPPPRSLTLVRARSSDGAGAR